MTTSCKNGSLFYKMFSLERGLSPPERSFFLFGPRGVGKSTWLKRHFGGKAVYNLLDPRLFLRLSRDPGVLRAELLPMPRRSWVVIDEVQKVPAVLDVVHEMIEERALRFALSGSSARKLRRGGGNLLAGRAVTRSLFPFTSAELGDRFDLDSVLRFGALPLVCQEPESARDILATYFQTYIREEVREEGLVRKIEPFLRFLEVAGLMNGQQVNASALAREASVPRTIVDQYFSVLQDTLVGHLLPAYRPRAKVREQGHPKFYWFDAGVARAAAGLLDQEPESEWMGRSLETWVLHELRSALAYAGLGHSLSYYRTKSGVEVDFVLELKKATLSKPAEVVTIEVKHSRSWDSRWSKVNPLADASGVKVRRSLGVYLGERKLSYPSMEVLPVAEFGAALHGGRLF